MAKILNVSYRKFQEKNKYKKVALWGAGKLAKYYIETFCKELNIIFIVDKNESLSKTNLSVNGVNYPIISEKIFLEQVLKNDELRENLSIFITPTVYAGEIIKHINSISILDAIECYVGVLMRDYYVPQSVTFSSGKDKIPKKIHYCWFGNTDIPDYLKKYIESWYKYCPNYEIIRWDEKNYDISKNRYMKEAYECKKWAFVPDYARLDIIYNEGGIYLDTDVELLSSLDKLLKDDIFFGFSGNFQIGIGVGFGAIEKHPFIKELRDYYNDLTFYLEDGKPNLKTCYEYQHPVFEKYGFQLENSFQKKNGIVLYPSEVLSPDMGLISSSYTENTISVHHFDYSWASEEEKKVYTLLKKEIASLIMI